jgi:hypothetical protein
MKNSFPWELYFGAFQNPSSSVRLSYSSKLLLLRAFLEEEEEEEEDGRKKTWKRSYILKYIKPP